MAVLPRSTPPSDPLVAGVAFDGLENDLVDGGFVGEGSEEEEEVLTEHAGPGGSSSFEAVLLQLEQVMMEPHFEEEVGGFLSAHCDEFEEGENKLQYTAIFERYVAVLEAHIEKALAARVVGLDFSAFCAELLERGPSALGEQLNLDVLGSFGFEGFKELMLAEKRGRQCCGGLVGAPLPLHADEQEDGEAIPDLNLHITPVPSLWRHAQQPSGI